MKKESLIFSATIIISIILSAIANLLINLIIKHPENKTDTREKYIIVSETGEVLGESSTTEEGIILGLEDYNKVLINEENIRDLTAQTEDLQLKLNTLKSENIEQSNKIQKLENESSKIQGLINGIKNILIFIATSICTPIIVTIFTNKLTSKKTIKSSSSV